MNTTDTPKRIHFITLGCSKNEVDTETMLAGLPGHYTLTDDASDAEVIVVNTCAFLESAKEQSIDKIIEMAEMRDAGRMEKLVVTGCLAQRYPEELARELPEVDHFVGTNDLTKVTALLDGSTTARVHVGNPDRIGYNWEGDRSNLRGTHSAFLKVAEGCSNTCAFCIIPTLRGPQRSRGVDSCVAEAQRLVRSGVRELNLIAQDLTAWGYDLTPRSNLTTLLEALAQVDGVHWIRLLYAYPRNFPKGLVDLMAREPRIAPYLDMPLQHISESVLKRMKRGTSADQVRRRVAELRERVPGLAFRTTFIVGFPGETDAEFEELLDFVKFGRFERLGAFTYSREEGTPAYDMPDQLPDDVKQARFDALMTLQRGISRELNREAIGREVEVLVEGLSEDSDLVWVGRTAQQAPEVDGITYLSGFEPEQVRPGRFVRGRIEQVTDYDLVVGPL